MALLGAVCAMRGVGCARLRRAGEGAGAGERAESSGAGSGQRRERAERRGARAQGRERAQRERERERERASPMVLHCVVGEEVAATFGSLEIRLGASLFVSLGAGGILSTTCDDYLLACP